MIKAKMNPWKAYQLYWQNAFNFHGRARRKEYWWPLVFNLAITFILSFIVEKLGGGKTGDTIVYWITTLLIFIPDISVFVRRIQDTGMNGKWGIPFALLTVWGMVGDMLLGLIPDANNIWINTVLPAIAVTSYIATAIYLIFMLFVLVSDGEEKRNEYGESPKYIK